MAVYVSGDPANMKNYSPSCKDTQDKDDWRLKIKGQLIKFTRVSPVKCKKAYCRLSGQTTMIKLVKLGICLLT